MAYTPKNKTIAVPIRERIVAYFYKSWHIEQNSVEHYNQYCGKGTSIGVTTRREREADCQSQCS